MKTKAGLDFLKSWVPGKIIVIWAQAPITFFMCAWHVCWHPGVICLRGSSSLISSSDTQQPRTDRVNKGTFTQTKAKRQAVKHNQKTLLWRIMANPEGTIVSYEKICIALRWGSNTMQTKLFTNHIVYYALSQSHSDVVRVQNCRYWFFFFFWLVEIHNLLFRTDAH